ncbi:uncharacterized protein LOC141652000 [Silene latifolia]|uniref:uncharacterized protein LOC141652000 n=1 Tax=Silene latifolia TaxID=37657 RepID=UPI003D78A5D0
MTIQDCLSFSDVQRLKDINVTLESNEGEFLSPIPKFLQEPTDRHFSEELYEVVEPNSDGSIPEDAIFSLQSREIQFAKELMESYKRMYLERYKTKKLSAGMSEFLWPSDKGDTQVEFRSPVPRFPPPGQLRVVCTNTRGSGHRKRKAGGEYCLAANKDGTVNWLPESECVDGNHVWTVHLFERRAGEVLYLRDQLQRTEPNIYNNCEFTYIGGNVNGSGTQTIGNVTTNQLLGFRKVYQLVQKFSEIIS